MTALADRCANDDAHIGSATSGHKTLLNAAVACMIIGTTVAGAIALGYVGRGAIGVVIVGQILAVVAVLNARARIGDQLHAVHRLAECDPATGCLNRRGFARALDQVLSEASVDQRDVALLALDLDHFKNINDRHGHNVGDAVLFEVASTLVQTVGDQGVVARLGGEEFSVLMPCADAETAGVMAERLIEEVRTHRLSSVTADAFVTMSIGISAERVSSVRDSAALRARADEALYAAKRGGRNRSMLWAPGVPSLATPAAAAVAIVTPRRWQLGGMH